MPTFDGKKEEFRSWWKRVKHHMLLYQDYFRNRSDSEKILIIGEGMKGEAQSWLLQYTTNIEKKLVSDSLELFEERLEERFTSMNEPAEALRKIDQLRYDNDIETLIRKFRDHNELAGLNGPVLKAKIENLLSKELQTRIITSTEEPEDDEV